MNDVTRDARRIEHLGSHSNGTRVATATSGRLRVAIGCHSVGRSRTHRSGRSRFYSGRQG